jgi:Transposase, Mutator family
MALRGLLEKSSDTELLREMIGFAAERLMALEASGLTRAAHGERSESRITDEVKWRTDVVGIFRNEAAITRLIGAILLEQSDEWATQRSRYVTLETIGAVSDNPTASLPAVAG